MRLTIDGKQVEAPANTLVVEAAKPLGIHIPVFCYHPKLNPVGMCRMCLVEVGTPRRGKDGQVERDAAGSPAIAWMPKMQTACTTVVSEGMAVRTNTSAVAEARRSVIEFLLTSHPLDCPICDKGGECPLQDHTLAYGPGASRFRVESKFHSEKRVPLGPLVMLDRERCIQCSRCVRFQTELAGDPVLNFASRGRGLEIVTLDNPPFDSKFSGNTIDICPVGALTSRDFRFTARVFELNDRPSICPHCSVGCNQLIGERDNAIQRITPRQNEAVNEIWLCDKGRYVHHFATAPDRLTQPLARLGGELKPVAWYDALRLIGARLTGFRAEFGGAALAGLAGDRVSNEDLYLFQKLFREVLGSPNLDHRVGWSRWNAGHALVRDLGAGVGTNLGELSENTTVLLLGADPEQEQPVIRLRLSKSVRLGARLIVANPRQTKLARDAQTSLLFTPGAELHLLLGLLAVIQSENLWNAEALYARASAVDAFQAAVAAFPLEHFASRCGVSPETLQGIARAFASAQNGLVLFGRDWMFALEREPELSGALAALLVGTGHIGRRDNGLVALLPHNNSSGAADMGLLPRHGPGRVDLPHEQWGMPLSDLLGNRPRALYVMGCDPARDAEFRKPEFLIVQDLFLTETASRADVVLPAQSWAEREGTFTNTERRVQLFRPALRPHIGARADWSIIQDIARQLGAGWNFPSTAAVMAEISARVPSYAGISYDRLATTARRRTSVYTVGSESVEPVQIALGELFGDVSGAQWPSRAESDPSARFELPSQFAPASASPPQPPSAARGFSLLLERSLYDRGTLVSRSEIIQSRVPLPHVEINSQDARELDLHSGATAQLTLDTVPPRQLTVAAHVDGNVPPGVVALPENLEGAYGLPMGARARIERSPTPNS